MCEDQVLSWLTQVFAFIHAVLPDSPNFPYRRYERLPPINQFSIESDSDLSETAELIEEYEVFDPSRPRPKIILIIGKPNIWDPFTRIWIHSHLLETTRLVFITPAIFFPNRWSRQW